MWSNVGKSEGLLPFRETLGPICLMIVTFFLAPLFVHSNSKLDGSLWTLGEKLYSEPIATVVSSFFGEEDGRQDRFSKAAIFLFIFSAFEIALQQLVPGKPYHGPITPKGHIPVYKANGFQCFMLTVLVFLLVPAFLGESSPFQRTIIAEIYPELITILCIGSFFFCGWLYVKGHVAPSGPDSGTSGNAVIDFYWGMELYPRVGSWDVKLFTNCRFGLMLWVLAPISFAAQQMISHPVGDDLGYGGLSYAMAVNVALQLAYLTKVSVFCGCAFPLCNPRRRGYPKQRIFLFSVLVSLPTSCTLQLCSSMCGRLGISPPSTSCTIVLATTFAGDASSGCQ